MNIDILIQNTKDYVKDTLSKDSSGHDWWHIYRVWRMARQIGEKEQANLVVVELAALLHDIADWKFHGGDLKIGPQVAKAWLEKNDVTNDIISQVCEIIYSISFKGAKVETVPLSLEGQIVQDADRLDAIGAIGIGRTFAYGGHQGRKMYEPTMPPNLHASFEEYKNSDGTTINHFYEKLLLLKDRMNTNTGKQLASNRHAFMLEYLNQFMTEWKAES